MQQQQQSRGILLITRSANLIFQHWPVWRGSGEEVERSEGGGGLTAEEGGLGDTSKTKELRTPQCASVVSLSPCMGLSLTLNTHLVIT